MSSSTSRPHPSSTSSTTQPNPMSEKSFFEQQRDVLMGEIAVSLEHVLQNINKLNRSLEGVIAVGNEFGSVEALWSQFENVMAKDPEAEEEGEGREEGDEVEGKGEEEDATMRDEGEA
ncbi:MAG: hypothetical protein M1827_002507 [Pycnora praestabilis]|nr:MAG: hypothetical protein M1827_002507 [Pycnora praestabilis]